MMYVKAKDKNDWKVWHYGILEEPAVVRVDGRPVKVIPRTVCEDTGLTCKGRAVYENDWLAVEDNDGDVHKFLVAMHEKEYRAYEDEDISYSLVSVLRSERCRIVGNLYD